jgi:hypothetical protein
MTIALLLLAAIALLQAADVVTTAKALKRGASEVNPVARALFWRLGVVPAAIAAKLLFTAPMAAMCLLYPTWWPVPALYAASLVWVVHHNLKVLKSQRSGGG